MARNEKLSRIKGIPARLQLTARDAATGSFPTIQRLAADNRKGGYNTFFDDTTPLIFSTASVDVYLGTGLRVSDTQYITTENTTSLIETGSVNSSITDQYITPYLEKTMGTMPQQNLQPFRDFDRHAADGKSTNDPFYATGTLESKVGEGGFDQPLWSKNIIEINRGFIPGNTIRQQFYQDDVKQNIASSSFSYDKVYDYTNVDYPVLVHGANRPMVYLGSNQWDPIGGQIMPIIDAYGAAPSIMYASGTYGFSPGFAVNYSPLGLATSKGGTSGSVFINSYFTQSLMATTRSYELLLSYCSNSLLYNNVEYMQEMAQPMSNYAFPYGPQYQANTDQTIKLKDFINKPFLVEKIVIQISGVDFSMPNLIIPGDFEGSPTPNYFYQKEGLIFPVAMNTVFIMNQKKNQSFRYTDPNTYAFNLQRKTSRFGYNIQRENPITTQEQQMGTSSLVGQWSKEVSIPTYFSDADQWESWYYGGGEPIEQTYVNTTRDLIGFGTIVSCPNEVTGTYTRHMVRPILHSLLSMTGSGVTYYFDEFFGNKYTNIWHLHDTFQTTFVLYPASDLYLVWYASLLGSAYSARGMSSEDIVEIVRNRIAAMYSANDVVVTQSIDLKRALNAECYVDTGMSIAQSGTQAFSFTNQNLTIPITCKSPFSYGYLETAMKDILQTAISGSGGQVFDLSKGIDVSTINGLLSNNTQESVINSLKGGMIDGYDFWKGGRNGVGFNHLSTRDFLNSFGAVNEANVLAEFMQGYMRGVNATSDIQQGDSNAFEERANEYLKYSESERTKQVPVWFGFDALAPGQIDPDIYTNSATSISTFYNAHQIAADVNAPYTLGKINPYLLYPEDELIIGWQLPLINTMGFNTFASMSVSGTYDPTSHEWKYDATFGGTGYFECNRLTIADQGTVKISLYGSALGNNKPMSDSETLNQLLTSNAIHETIG